MLLLVILIITAFLFAICMRRVVNEPFSLEIYQKEDPDKYRENVISTPDRPSRIFVSVASYRDSRCINTCKEIFDNANFPQNIFIGICQQNNEDDIDCGTFNEFRSNARIVRLPSSAAQGPTYARYVCSKLWQGEEYYMQIDAHMKFEKGWDTELIKMLSTCDSNKPILTHYPLSVEQSSNSEKLVPLMCNSKWNDNGMIQLYAELKKITDMDNPRKCPYAASGFFFLRNAKAFLSEVPYDPYLPFLFQGEEILHSARLWTNGWDFFQPTKNLIVHFYGNEDTDKKAFWKEHVKWHEDERESLKRAKYILGLENDLELAPDFFKIELNHYGLGKSRSITDYFAFSGIDPTTMSTSSRC